MCIAPFLQRLATVTAKLDAKQAEAEDWRRKYMANNAAQTTLERNVTADITALTAENEEAGAKLQQALTRAQEAEAEVATLRAEVSELREQLRTARSNVQVRCALGPSTNRVTNQANQLEQEARTTAQRAINERDRATALADSLGAEVRVLRVTASGATFDKEVEASEMAKVIRAKNDLERELLEALQENEALRGNGLHPAPVPQQRARPAASATATGM